MKDVEITREPIELFKLLKFEGLASSGGEAKAMIAEGRVLLNGIVETQKRKKLVSGDCIELGDTKLQLRLIGSPDPA
jgi:ribosome-associated protein